MGGVAKETLEQVSNCQWVSKPLRSRPDGSGVTCPERPLQHLTAKPMTLKGAPPPSTPPPPRNSVMRDFIGDYGIRKAKAHLLRGDYMELLPTAKCSCFLAFVPSFL